VLLGARARHRDRRLVRRLAGVLMLRRVNEKLMKLAVMPRGCPHDRAVLDRALGLRMRERSNET
jgi:hypothetical protein